MNQSDVISARSCDGVNPVSRTVSLMFHYLRHSLPVFKLTPPSLRALNPSSNMQSQLTMQRTQLPPHRPWDCAIDLLLAATLPKGRVYPLSIPERKAMENYIKEALRQRLIHHSTSPAASSFVGKKDRILWPCFDYRTLNDHTVKLPYPLPLVPAALEELRGSRIYSKLDLRSVYNLVRIREGDEWKRAFITLTNHYEYHVMPYGLSNSPFVFQGFMNEVFRQFLNRFVIVYINVILIYSRKLAEYRHHVTQVLEKPTSSVPIESKWTRGRSKPSGTGPNHSQSRNSNAS